MDLTADHHVRTLFSDGAATVDEVVRAAEQRRLAGLVISDRVGADTTWLPAYVAAVRRAAARSQLRVSCGITTAILDTAGRLDLPPDLGGVEYLAVAAERFPLRAGTGSGSDVRLLLGTGLLTPTQALELLLKASLAALRRAADWAQPVLVDPLGIAAAVGIAEPLRATDLLGRLAEGCLASGAAVQVEESRRSPPVPVAVALARLGVPLVAGSGARRAVDIGRWDYVRLVAGELTTADQAAE